MYPKRLQEVIEAIEEYYHDDQEMIIDCMLYLKNIVQIPYDIEYINNWFLSNNLCYRCGETLSTMKTREFHSEVDGGAYENFIKSYCSNCDI